MTSRGNRELKRSDSVTWRCLHLKWEKLHPNSPPGKGIRFKRAGVPENSQETDIGPGDFLLDGFKRNLHDKLQTLDLALSQHLELQFKFQLFCLLAA